MKNKKGISLIVLIITIIVMLIIAGAIIISLTETNVIDQAEEATFKMQVRDIQDALMLKKASLMAEAGGTLTQYNITLASLGIGEDAYSKFSSKLVIDKKTGELYYQMGNVTEQEEDWLKDLGIKGKGSAIHTGTDFVADVIIATEANRLDSGWPNYYAIIDSIRNIYEGTAVLARNTNNSEHFTDARDKMVDIKFADLCVKAVKQLEIKYSSTTIVNDTIEQEVREMLGGEEYETRINLSNIFTSSEQTVGDITKKLKESIEAEEIDIIEYFLVNDKKIVKITKDGASEYSLGPEYNIANSEEATKFTWTEYDNVSDGYIKGTITGFNDTSNTDTIIVPSLIIKEDGEPIFIEKIATGAFSASKPMELEAYSTLMEYAAMVNLKKTYDQTTLAEVAAIAGSVGGNTNTTGYTEDRAGKNQFLLENFLSKLVPSVEEYFTIEGTGKDMKVYGIATLDRYGTPTFYPKGTNHIKAPNIIISEGIQEIEAKIVENRWISSIYIPSTLTSASSAAFANACILNVKSRMSFDDVLKLDNDAESGIFDTYLGEEIFEQVN